jgi:LuxR family maltose regulon positive regulatory protein
MKLEAGDVTSAGRDHIIKRPRLTRLLDETDARIILLVAPAGYGKTTLAREWLADRPHAWYRGSGATADVAALAIGLAKAVSAVVPGAGKRLTERLRISRAPASEIERLADLLAEDLIKWPDDALLVLDDYHFACDSETTEQFVGQFVSQCTFRVLVSSRTRPRWASARRVLYGEIFEVGRNLLAMDSDEARTVLEDRFAAKSGLLSLADGWPALIGMAILSQELIVPGEAVPEELYGFFAEELYQGIEPGLQQGLRRFALAPYVTSDIAETVVGANAGAFIEEGVQLGFFLLGRERLELHPLLKSFLGSKFQRRLDDPTGEIVAALAKVLISREEWDDVFELASRFADDNVLIELFEASLPHMLEQARLPTLARWITTAGSRGLDSPVVDLADAELALRRGQLARAEAIAGQAARRLGLEHRSTSRALWVAGTSAHLSTRDEASLDHFESAEQAAASDEDARQAVWGQFLAVDGLERHQEAEKLLSVYEACSTSEIDELLRIATGRFRMALLCGGVVETLEAHRDLMHLVDRSRDPLIRSSFLNSYATLLGLSGDYAEALSATETGLDFIRSACLDFALPYAYLNAAATRLGLRQFRSAATALSHCARAAKKSGFVTCNVGVLRARVRLASGQFDEAVKDLEQVHPFARSCHPAQAEHLAWWSFARAAAGDRRGAIELAKQAECLSRRIEVSALVPWTRAVLANGNRSERRIVCDAFSNAVVTGNIDAFVTVYRARPRLLEILVDSGCDDRLELIVERACDHSLAEQTGLQLSPARNLGNVSTLTKREHEVLDLVSQGLLNKEIARTLFITEGTVKVHVRRICQKLGVRTRTEAAVLASELRA